MGFPMCGFIISNTRVELQSTMEKCFGQSVTFSAEVEGNNKAMRSTDCVYIRQNSVNEERRYLHRAPSQTDDQRGQSSAHSVDEKWRPSLNRHPSAFNSRTVKYLFILSLALNALLLFSGVVVAVFFGMYYEKANRLKQTKIVVPQRGSHMGCYPCGNKGIPGVDSLLVTSNGYCLVDQSHEDFKMLIGKKMFSQNQVAAVAARFAMDCARSNGSNKKQPSEQRVHTAALLVLDTAKSKSSHTIKWQSRYSEAFLMGAANFSNNSLCLRKGGLVKLHSHFGLDTVNNRQYHGEQFLTHYISKVTPSDGKHTTVAFEKLAIKEHTYKAADLDKTVRLRTGDCVNVYFSHPSIIYDLPIANFFELILLD